MSWPAMTLCLCVTLFAACGDSVKNESAIEELAQTEKNQTRLAKSDPPPQFRQSQERKNLIRKLERWNVADKISYIYLMTSYGQIVYYSTVKGKVSSLNSMLTCTEQPYYKYRNGGAMVTLPSPDFDGSYGPNPDGIFFFNQDGVYVEWNGKYLLTDQPLKISVEPLLLSQDED